MAVKNQLTGGAFQDASGNPISGGSIELVLSQDAITTDGVQVAAGYKVTIPLDVNGNIVVSPEYAVWPNDVLSPSNTFYNVTVYSAQGQTVWGPNAQQVFSTPTPFNVGAWVPGTIFLTDGYVTTYNVGVFLPGSYISSQYYLLLPLERTVRYSQNMAPSKASCSNPPLSTVTMPLLKNGVQFGTLVFNPGSTAGVYTTTSASTTFFAGDLLEIVMPSVVDPQLVNIGVVLSGTTVS